MSQEDMYKQIEEHYKAGVELTDEELDIVADIAVDGLKSILDCFGETDVIIDEYEGTEGELILNVTNGDLAILIGRHGRVLDAMQSLLCSLVTRKLSFHYPVSVDIEGYKARRRQKVMEIAVASAERAKSTGRSVRMKPMNAYERRLVHMALKDDEEVITASQGREPSRYVVIKLVK